MLEKKIQKRKAFFISDKTGITAEMLGHSILSQFDEATFIEKQYHLLIMKIKHSMLQIQSVKY